MNRYQWVMVAAAAFGLAACDGGGVNMKVATTDNSVDNSISGGGGGDTNPCASYVNATTGDTVQGTFDGINCSYSASFVGKANPLTQDLTIPLITGAHIFQDSLFVGVDLPTGGAPAGGEGPTLTIEPGNTLVFSRAQDYLLINRGSQIVADGSPAAPITLTAFADAVAGTAGANDVQLWGGVVINGNGITNNCTDEERAADQCNVTSEGQPSTYGGDNNEDSSGVLRYVIVKHTGFEVAPGDELNGVTFNAVGSGTIVENVEVYSTYDDGLEFFGGAVSPKNVVVLYARDDSLDFSDGFVGTIENALIIHYSTDGNRCIEGDNIGSGRSEGGEPLDTAPLSQPVVRNMTCIPSNFDGGTHGDSEGPLGRQGAKLRIEDSIVYAGYGNQFVGLPSNECLEIESDVSLAFAAAGESYANSVLIACEEPAKGTFANGDELIEWVSGNNPSTNGANYSFNTDNVVITDSNNANVSVLEAGTFYTSASLTDADGNAITISPASGKLGAVLSSDDWTVPWAFGLRATNADEPLWFSGQ